MVGDAAFASARRVGSLENLTPQPSPPSARTQRRYIWKPPDSIVVICISWLALDLIGMEQEEMENLPVVFVKTQPLYDSQLSNQT